VQVPVSGIRGVPLSGIRRRARASSRGGVWRKLNPKMRGDPAERDRLPVTGYEVWYIRDEWARDYEVLHPQWGVLYKSGVYALTVI